MWTLQCLGTKFDFNLTVKQKETRIAKSSLRPGSVLDTDPCKSALVCVAGSGARSDPPPPFGKNEKKGKEPKPYPDSKPQFNNVKSDWCPDPQLTHADPEL
jgi:hypothetical protein